MIRTNGFSARNETSPNRSSMLYVQIASDADFDLYLSRKRGLEAIIATASLTETEDHDVFVDMVKASTELGMPCHISQPTGFDKGDEEEQLLRRLQPFNTRFNPDSDGIENPRNSLVGNLTGEDYYALRLAEDDTTNADFFRNFLTLLNLNSRLSLSKGEPNYSLDTQKLMKRISGYLSFPFNGHLSNIPPIIYGHDSRKEKYSNIRKQEAVEKARMLRTMPYVLSFTQPTEAWFGLDAEMMSLSASLVNGSRTSLEKSEAIHEWISKNINYGKSKRPKHIGYRTPIETYYSREGVCGETALLQVVMERSVGNRAFVADVPTEKHALTVNIGSNGKFTLIDTTHSLGHDVYEKRKKYRIMQDNELARLYSDWRKIRDL